MALAVASQLLTHGDRFLLALYGVENSHIGLWGASGTIVWALIAVPQLVAVSLYPSFSRLAATGGSPRRIALRVGLGAGVAGVLFALALQVAGDPLIRLAFGPEFSPAGPLLQRASWALPGAFAMMVLGVVLAAWRMQRRTLWVLAAALTLSTALNMVWIPRVGVLAPATIAPLVYTAAAVVLVLSCLRLRAPDEGSR